MSASNRSRSLAALSLAALLLATGCSGVKKISVNALARSLSSAGGVFITDDDPELVRDALPFTLKTFEALLEISPENGDLLLATCSGFVNYGYAFVELEAELIEPEDYYAAKHLRGRAQKLYARARGYCFRALDKLYPGTSEVLILDPEAALAATGKDDVALLYWTAVSWGAMIALGLDQPELVIDVPSARAVLERCLVLDPDYHKGALHDLMIAVEGLPEELGGSLERARFHYRRALELNGGTRASTHIAWATKVALRQQDRAEFEEALQKALAIDPDAVPSERLVNLVQQRYGRFLLDQIDELFI